MQLDITKLTNVISEMPIYLPFIENLKTKQGEGVVVLDGAKSFLIAALYQTLQVPIIVITAQPNNCRQLYEQLLIWSQSNRIKPFPKPDALPYERIASDTANEMERIQALAVLTDYNSNKPDGEAPLVIVSSHALMSKTLPYSDFNAICHTIKAGMNIEPYHLLSKWLAMGYRQESIVEVPGTVSHRGGIVDIYSPNSELPARLEFFGNTIESIRLFDPENQRSVRSKPSIAITPATELLTPFRNKPELERIFNDLNLTGCTGEAKKQFTQVREMMLEGQEPVEAQFWISLFNKDSILNYLPKDTLIIIDEPQRIKHSVEELDAKAELIRSEKLEGGELPGNFPKPYFNWNELDSELNNRKFLRLEDWDIGEDLCRFDFKSANSFGGQLDLFARKTKQLLTQKQRIIIVSHQASRLSELLGEANIIASPLNEIKQIPPPGSLTLVQGALAEGWVMNGNTHLFTDAEIFGFVKQRRQVKRHPVSHQQLLVDIAPGNYIVHVEHGIARFSGVITLSSNGSEKEYLVLQYACGDKMYVPTDQIDRVNRYVGASDRTPSLSRLGTQEWVRTKQRAKEAVENLAQDLLVLYASREVVPGFAFSPDALWQQELEASFAYVETPDQMETQRDVKGDMEKAKPMDRLVCGDVGYGKTEVAIRAAFKAVIDNKQVALLVPTTLLAEQHFSTVRERLEAFPIRIEVLSRFKSPKEQRVILDEIARGTVDICIGTHRLLQKDVVFKDLGLLIIDEEQRFGVAHKEYLKQKRREVDVLTLSATPIPRTMHMALVGVRDMSTMETPPEDRLPVKTYVAEFNDRLIREAIIRELERNGQVFFVHNRVQSIVLVAEKLRELVPEAEIVIAHGQMPEEKLESVMSDFALGKSDLLVCTTIIEDGLDMPNVNTVIVNRADKFGLTQLYQLRGRVGRGANLAYAYFLYDGGKNLTPTAQKRLRTIFEATELGAGFNVAMKDLEIRGAGNLLGTRQSGYISAVGFSLYCRLLAEAVEEYREKQTGLTEPVQPRFLAPAIDLPLNALIPDDYVPDVLTRLELYQNLAKVERVEQLEDIKREYDDRFGPLPPVVKNLLYVVNIKALAAPAGIESIYLDDGQVVIQLLPGRLVNKQKLKSLMKENIKLGTTQIRLNLKRLSKDWKGVLGEVVMRMK